MKQRAQIYHHLGLGDHIICNGLVRELCKRYDQIDCFVKTRYLSAVGFMYRDEPKITLVPVGDDWEVPSKINKDVETIKIGFEKLDRSIVNFDESFYRQVAVDFSLRWDNFYLERDYEGEQRLLAEVNPARVPHAFVHDDPSRGLSADLSFVGKGLKIIKASDCFINGQIKPQFEKYNFFHWIRVLETSQEIHCMDSSFKCLIESLPILEQTRLFFHRYIKGASQVCTTRQNWAIVRTPSLFFLAEDSSRRIWRKLTRRVKQKGRPDRDKDPRDSLDPGQQTTLRGAQIRQERIPSQRRGG